MKVTAHIMVDKDYHLGIACDQQLGSILESAEEYNKEHFGDDSYLIEDRYRAVVTVEFEVPDSVFKREKVIKITGKVKP